MERLPAAAGELPRLDGRPGSAAGALAGGLLTAPLVGLMYLLNPLAAWPFVPFALFDWIARVLPGPVVTFGIDLMIDGLRLFGMSVAASAKTAEQVAAILLFLFLGVVAVSIYFAILRRQSLASAIIPGSVLGMLFGLPLVVISLGMGQYAGDPSVAGLGLLVLFLAWGVASVKVYLRLAANADGLATEDEIRWVKSISRRQFMIRLGAATATITVVGSGLVLRRRV